MGRVVSELNVYFSDKDSSFYIYSVMKYTRNLLFSSMHKDWYICQSAKKNVLGTEVNLDFYNGEPDVLDRCSFVVQPIQENDNKLMNCKNVVGPVEHPEINGQPLPHPPHLVPDTTPPPPALPVCIPVCPAGTTGETPGEQPNAGTSALTIPTSPGFSGIPEIVSLSCSKTGVMDRHGYRTITTAESRFLEPLISQKPRG